MTKSRRDASKEAFWRVMIERQAASKLSVRAFCRQEGLRETSFHAWRRTIHERDGESTPKRPTTADHPAAAFVPAVIGPPAPTSESITIELPRDIVLRMPESIRAARLAQLVRALETRAPENEP